MTDALPNPPHLAEALLRSFSRPSDCESIPGDLLEEYREMKHPSLGRLRANAWYVTQVLSVLWRVMWPCAVAISALRVLEFTLPGGWNPSLVQAPGVSLLDALVFLWAGYHGSRRTSRLSTGMVMAGTTSALGATMFFAYAAIALPSLLLAPFEKPFIFLIVSVVMAMALGFGVAFGTVGAAVARWLPPAAWKARVS